jgi:hypothetical protein
MNVASYTEFGTRCYVHYLPVRPGGGTVPQHP